MYGLISLFSHALILFVLGVIAFIVLTILAYSKFLGKNADKQSRGGSFFNFNHFYIEKIIKLFYLIGAIGIAVFSICMPIFGFTSGFGPYRFDLGAALIGFFGWLIAGVFFFVISQFIYRLIYEVLLMFANLVSDTNSIRRHIVGSDDSSLELASEHPVTPQPPCNLTPSTSVSSWNTPLSSSPQDTVTPVVSTTPVTVVPTPAVVVPVPAPAVVAEPTAAVPMVSAAPAAIAPAPATIAPATTPAPVTAAEPAVTAEPAATAPQPVVEPAATPAPAATWTCQCGHAGNQGRFCPKCGSPRP